LEFEWDRRKARGNRVKHGVTFEEAVTVFGDPFGVSIPDPLHSESEDRFLVLGRSHRDRLLVVVYMERAERVRIISARRATRREGMDYEEGLPPHA